MAQYEAGGEEWADFLGVFRNHLQLNESKMLLKSYSECPCQSFVELSQKSYHAGLEKTDFMRAWEDSRKQINGWVEERTEGECFARCCVLFNVSPGLSKELFQDTVTLSSCSVWYIILSSILITDQVLYQIIRYMSNC